MKGSRSPAFKLVPPAKDRTAGKQAIELLKRVGMSPDPWQQDILLAGMGRDRAGHWAADQVAEIVARQNGKTVPLYGRVLWGVKHGGEKRTLWSAHEFKTAQESFLGLQELVGHDEFRDLEPKVRISNGKEGIEFNTGARISFIARSKSSGRGLGGDCGILDEAFAITDHQMAALVPTLSAREHPQLWFASSAPLPDSAYLRRLCLRGRRQEATGLVYFEWCAPDDAENDDPAAWAQANPALGRRLTERFTRTELETLSPEDFARERLGIWHEEEHVSVLPGWSALADPTARPTKDAPRALAADISPDRRRASIGNAALLPDGRMLVHVVESAEGASWVVPRLVELHRQSGLPVVIDNYGQGQTLIASLEAQRVKVVRTDAGKMVAACGQFFDRAQEGRLAHLGDGLLTAAVEGAKQRDQGDGWAWSRKKSSVDITPLVACTLAAWGVENAKPARREVFVA